MTFFVIAMLYLALLPGTKCLRIIFMSFSQEKTTGEQSVFVGEIVNVDSLGDKCDKTVAPQKKKQDISLDSAKGDIIFLRKLVGLRHLFAGKDFKNGYVNLLGECFHEGINTDLQGVTKRRRYFLDLFSRKKREQVSEYTHWHPLAVICGNESVDILKGTIYEEHGCGEINFDNFPFKCAGPFDVSWPHLA